VAARACTGEAVCTRCGTVSRRVHSSYRRRLADTAAGGREVLIDLQARRFFCDDPACSRTTFAEQVPGLTTRYGRRTSSLQAVLQAVALALGGRAGARLTARLSCAVSRSTLIRLIRAAADPDHRTPLVLGVDDFALRKGHVYGTILVDIETRRPVDMLPERSAESFRTWLDTHPGVEIICRDRGGCYAEGAAQGAPLAAQVADRWHLRHNLAQAVKRAVARHRSCLQDPPAEPGSAPAARATPVPEGGLAARTRARHAEVHAALARGLTLTQASRALRLDPKTVGRYAAAAAADELTGGPRLTRPGLLGPHQAWLRQWWDEGIRSTETLYAGLRDRGYQGSLRTLEARHRAAGSPRTPRSTICGITFASTALAKGVPISEVSRWLGHRSITTTVDLYGHLVPEASKRARDAPGRSLRRVVHVPPMCPRQRQGSLRRRSDG